MQLLLALVFYIVFSLFAFIGLPFTLRYIRNKTVAYLVAKPLGLVLFGYAVWLLSSVHILNYQRKIAITVLFLVAASAGWWFSRKQLVDEPQQQNKKNKPTPTQSWYKRIGKIELVSLSVYLIYLWLRAHHATVNGTESFMDMAMLQASGKTDFFPFVDPWYAGKAVNYYYYGSYLVSVISNLSRISYAFTYNFALGLWFTQACMLAGAFVWMLTASKKFAVLSALLVTVAGTLFYAGCVMSAASKPGEAVCSYASSTRLYTPSYIINEIPSYSFTVGDLHAHLLALPFFLMNLFLIYVFWNEAKPGRLVLLLLAIGFATSGLTSTWDLITLGVLLGVVALAKEWKRGTESGPGYSWWTQSGGTIGRVVLVGVSAAVLMVPALISYHSPTVGLGFAPSYVAKHNLSNVQYPTPLLAEFGMWGALVIPIASILLFYRRKFREYLLPASMFLVSLGIIVGVEIFFVGDIYSVANPPYFRANTTFKFGYHAWTLLSIVLGVLLGWVFTEKNKTRMQLRFLGFVSTLLFVAILGSVFYPYQALKQFYFPKAKAAAFTLDGSDWMKKNAPGDLATINYINKNIPGREVVVEAVGDSYTTYSRIVTFTGMVAPMGWKTHEWTWRFDGKAAKSVPIGQPVETGWGAVAKVADDIQRLYLTPNGEEARNIIDQYHIGYIYVGALERTTYPGLDEQKLSTLTHVVFESNGSKLYKVND